MPPDACILTTKDFTILEVMLDRCSDRNGTMGTLLRRKIDEATVVFSEDIASTVATLGSRVAFRMDDGQPDSRILSHDRMASSVGLFLPITSPVGLALLGLSEGQEFVLRTAEGQRRILLETLLYQPETARREREALARLATPVMRRKALRVVSGGFSEEG